MFRQNVDKFCSTWNSNFAFIASISDGEKVAFVANTHKDDVTL